MATIYGIKNPEGEIKYIGSTTLTLGVRISNHRSDARLNKGNCILYQKMRESDPNLFTIEPLEAVEIEVRYQAEGRAIQQHGTHTTEGGYNQQLPGRTKSVQRRAYREAHPEIMRAQRQRRAQRMAEGRAWANQPGLGERAVIYDVGDRWILVL